MSSTAGDAKRRQPLLRSTDASSASGSGEGGGSRFTHTGGGNFARRRGWRILARQPGCTYLHVACAALELSKPRIRQCTVTREGCRHGIRPGGEIGCGGVRGDLACHAGGQDAHALRVTPACRGLRILGTPLGTDEYVAAYFQALSAQFRAFLEVFPSVPDQPPSRVVAAFPLCQPESAVRTPGFAACPHCWFCR